jgi:hypothetical protein
MKTGELVEGLYRKTRGAIGPFPKSCGKLS